MLGLKARIIAFYRYLDFRILQKKYVIAGIIVLTFSALLLVFEYKIYWYLSYFGTLGGIINFGVLFFLGFLGVTLFFWGIYFDKQH